MDRSLKMKLANALSAISYKVIKHHKEDLLYELVDCVEHIERGEPYIMFARSTGADSANRFKESLICQNVTTPTSKQIVNEALTTLGLDLIVCVDTYEKVNGTKDIVLKLENVQLDKATMHSLESDLRVRNVEFDITTNVLE